MAERAYVKIALYKDEAIPMHYHWPYDYWQFPWEKHRAQPHIHEEILFTDWIWPDQTINSRYGSPYVPTEEELEWYNACLIKKTPGPMTPEQAYNMAQIMGQKKTIADLNSAFLRISRKKNSYYPSMNNMLRDANLSASIAVLAVQHVRKPH